MLQTAPQHFSNFKQAVDDGCYVCAKLWDSVADASIKGWSNEPGTWVPFDCGLERRTWAPRWYGGIYWHIRYLEFEMDPQVSFKYKGNVFCFIPCQGLLTPLPIKPGTITKVFRRGVFDAAGMGPGLSNQYLIRKSPPAGFRVVRSMYCLYLQDITDPPEYMTLSYRWAKPPSIRLLSSHFEVFRKGALISQLPKTFREAITVARRFSIRYLWIDSMCIIQDSPEDWARESLQMHLVYANSACTISATASEGPDEGPLTDRGWVFQERILSPRVLHFTKTQVVWECFEMNNSEMFPRWSPQLTDAVYTPGLKAIDAFFDDGNHGTVWVKEEDKKMTVHIYQQWINLVKTYSKCSLTCPDDRLMAMAGIAEMFKKNSDDEYLAGLWRSRIVEGLNWVVLEPGPRPQNPERVPSWSWAAVVFCLKGQISREMKT
ncbi:HET-domain-containing [Fusarium acutatum]|uniref:HET-domain-containing n=1 Tax=Fusarium acutatum TaxID=78861 RepID=A0A8H4JG53_9HYPO|nr:HET-domain-containing [Fusarium acutatum]